MRPIVARGRQPRKSRISVFRFDASPSQRRNGQELPLVSNTITLQRHPAGNCSSLSEDVENPDRLNPVSTEGVAVYPYQIRQHDRFLRQICRVGEGV